MHTEAEAKTKWCPMAWGGRRVTDGDQALCLASACMMWCTARPTHERYYVTYKDKPEEEWGWNPTGVKHYEDAKVRIVRGTELGYCGLAGERQR